MARKSFRNAVVKLSKTGDMKKIGVKRSVLWGKMTVIFKNTMLPACVQQKTADFKSYVFDKSGNVVS